MDDNELIRAMGSDSYLRELATDFLRDTSKYKYTYHFTWLGQPIIQLPQDIVAVQELIWRVQPDFIIETGIAHGGSLILSASILELLGSNGHVLGIDIEIQEHNRAAILQHPLAKRITMLEGSSVDENVIAKVRSFAKNKKRVFVMLDSDHTHNHVLEELKLYSPLVSRGSYLIVFDTAIEDMPPNFYPNRSWGKGNNPKTAVWEFLKTNDRFVVDKEIEHKLLITVAPDGYLRCVKD
ncbi:MAG: cephalosporin hydroxylase family protein [Thermodesulfobacteriota bacterium]|nr:cephalosporin hydroxylase family protein [Thermodesulfobacteriota bacterium]